MPSNYPPSTAPQLGLGIDTGGTQTRWALATADETIVASGAVDGLTALQFTQRNGREKFLQVFSGLAETVRQHGQLQYVRAGITGFGGEMDSLLSLFAKIFALPTQQIMLGSDMEIAYLELFEPGEGYLIYAGTGSIAAYIDSAAVLHRAGGRGYLLDDGGGGFWIAREALRHIWRMEDEQPDSWKNSILAHHVFAKIGATDWNASREFIYQRSRGEIGQLALAVAACADQDAVAREILVNAGRELARLGCAMLNRFGQKPLALCGRVQELHPLIVESLRSNLPPTASLSLHTTQAHFSAARLAARHI